MAFRQGRDAELITIPAELDVIGAIEVRQDVLASIAATAGQTVAIRVDLSSESATAPALQLAAATRRTLEQQGRFAGYGPSAEACFGNLG